MKYAKTLSREEMKHVMAGFHDCAEGWDSCKCYTEQGGAYLGHSCCTGLSVIDCCQNPFPEANYGECTLSQPTG